MHLKQFTFIPLCHDPKPLKKRILQKKANAYYLNRVQLDTSTVTMSKTQ